MFQKIIILFALLSAAAAVQPLPFFRRDYTYNGQFNKFYKVHTVDTINWNYAYEKCIHENSELFYPKSEDEWKVLEALFLNRDSNETFVLLGVHDEFINQEELITASGLPTPVPLLLERRLPGACVFMNINDGTITSGDCSSSDVHHFVCRRREIGVICPTIDRSYVLEKTTNKCYKINKSARTWVDALESCFMEGGNLLVIESEQENQIIQKIMLSNLPLDKDTFFVGFHRLHDGGLIYTVKGQTFDEGFYRRYSGNGYDNNYNFENNENCGVIASNMFVTTKHCDENLPFVCEMKTKYLN